MPNTVLGEVGAGRMRAACLLRSALRHEAQAQAAVRGRRRRGRAVVLAAGRCIRVCARHLHHMRMLLHHHDCTFELSDARYLHERYGSVRTGW